MSERSAAVEAARESVREAMIARTAYWYNAVVCTDDLRPQIESELAVADDEYESALDAFEAACRANELRDIVETAAPSGWGGVEPYLLVGRETARRYLAQLKDELRAQRELR